LDNGNHGGGPGCNQIDRLCWTFQDTGKATCELCLVGVPASATFSSTWAVATFRNDPCRAKSPAWEDAADVDRRDDLVRNVGWSLH
jgi:hypothetical protein